MTLLQIIRAIERVAKKQPAINMIVRNDIFRLNTYNDAKYGVFAWVQGQHATTVVSGLIRYQFSLIYADRLTGDLHNQAEVQSVGVQVISNIVRALASEDIFTRGDVTFQPFNQRFTDECAGVFANVTFEVPMSTMCVDGFGDFNEDFNNDFLVI